jgi:hypothetical protein
MDALGSLDEISEQTTSRVNADAKTKHVRRPARKFGWGISPNMERAKVAREKKKALRQPRPPGTGKSAAPPAAPVGAKLGRAFSDYRTLIETCRARADELDLSRAELDRVSGLCSGYASKILSLGAAKDSKRLGPVSFELMLNTLGLKMVLIEDEVATARTLALRHPVDHSQQRFGNVSRITARAALCSHEKR